MQADYNQISDIILCNTGEVNDHRATKNETKRHARTPTMTPEF